MKILLLVNQKNPLNRDYCPELIHFSGRQAVDKRIYAPLQEMLQAARKEGFAPVVISSYRPYETQEYLFADEIKLFIDRGYTPAAAEEEAGKWVAVPGTSEHQTGLALDIVSESFQRLIKEQETTPDQQWLMQNSWKYGFILRYPADKTEITGINYEPWHYRYVGKQAAKAIHEQKLCLEEYLQKRG